MLSGSGIDCLTNGLEHNKTTPIWKLGRQQVWYYKEVGLDHSINCTVKNHFHCEKMKFYTYFISQTKSSISFIKGMRGA